MKFGLNFNSLLLILSVKGHDAKRKRQQKNSSMFLRKHGKKENQHVEYSRFKSYRGR